MQRSVFYGFIFSLCLLFSQLAGFAHAKSANTVPVVMYSHRISYGLSRFQKNYKYNQQVPGESFLTVVKELIGHCNSDAYIFINLPGLLEYDLVQYREEFKYLEQYIHSSSTSVAFEKLQPIDDTFWNQLIDFSKEHCSIEKTVILQGNNTAQYVPYIDNAKRVIKIDFPKLPIEGRSETIEQYDQYLRTVLAQLPTPFHTVVLTSLDSYELETQNLNEEYEKIFSDHYDGVFKDILGEKRDKENNHRLLDVPVLRERHRPLHKELSKEYISIFDNNFIKEHYKLLQIIGTTMIIFIGFTLFNKHPSKHNSTKTKRNIDISKKEMVKKEKKKGEEIKEEKENDNEEKKDK